MSGPLAGIRVIDFSMYIAGPYASRLMADAGAEVIKIEPASGDFLRQTPPGPQGSGRQFGQLNCGKKSVVLNLKSATGLAAAKDLIKTADVVLENFRPGVMHRLGLDFDTVKALRPDIVYCSVSGYGQTGPSAGLAAFAPIVQAYCGHDAVQMAFAPELSRPLRNRNTAPDILAATHAYGAIVTALFQRANTGEGQYIDVTLIDCMHNLLTYEFQAAQMENPKATAVFGPVQTQDGFVMITPVSAGNFAGLARTIGHPEWLDDPRYAEAGQRIGNWDEIMAEVELWTIKRSAVECEKRLNDAGCPCARYRSLRESLEDPQVAARGGTVTARYGDDTFLVPNTPFRFADDQVGVKTVVPLVGEHTDEVLGQLKAGND